jgi:hypothetical protein
MDPILDHRLLLDDLWITTYVLDDLCSHPSVVLADSRVLSVIRGYRSPVTEINVNVPSMELSI